MKILLMGDASNYHSTLARGLQRAGHDVTVASNGGRWMRTYHDIDISRRKGRIGGALLWLKLNTVLRSRLKGYDVVQIHNPVFLELKPGRVKEVFDRLRRDNGAVMLTMLGTDTQYVEACFDADMPLRYNEFRVGDEPTDYGRSAACSKDLWLNAPLSDHCRYVYDNVDGVVSALYEYHLSCMRVVEPDRLTYAGIPIDTKSVEYTPIAEDLSNVEFLVACHKGRESIKGIDRIGRVIDAVVARNAGRSTVSRVSNLPYDEFCRVMQRANIVADQLYSYTPATTALLAMAQGKVVISGAEPEFYDFIGEDRLRPIINPDPMDMDRLDADLQGLIDAPSRLAELSRQGRAFVEKHNDADVVARRFIDFWERRMR